MANTDINVNGIPTCKSHELYLKMMEDKMLEENCEFGSHNYINSEKTPKDTRHNFNKFCIEKSKHSISDSDNDTHNDNTHVPTQNFDESSRSQSFSNANSAHITQNITKYITQSIENPSHLKNKAVMSFKENTSDAYKKFGKTEERLFFKNRRVKRSTGYENQRYEVLPGKDDDDVSMSVVVENNSTHNDTNSVINAEKQTVTTYEIIDWEDVPESVRHHFRKKAADRLASTRNAGHLGIGFGKKRTLRKQGIDKKKTTCMLYLQADHLFHEQMGYSEEACIEVMTRHVQRVNSIYRPIGK